MRIMREWAAPFDPIVAVSTPHGRGGVALIRMSGSGSCALFCQVFRPAEGRGRCLSDYPPRTAVYGRLLSLQGEEVDDGLAVYFPAPHSFTGEEVVEFTCHGGLLITHEVLATLLSAGFAQAEAGAFTRRAYINGKLRLDEVEALGNLLSAETETGLRLSRRGMKGGLSRAAAAVYDGLMDVVANLEAGMDFPEEDLTEWPREELIRRVGEARLTVVRLLETYPAGHAVAEGVATTLCGRPNVGKSALYNCLVGREAAIVTEHPGATRDVLTETVALGSVTLRLSDTAGLRESGDPVERMGMARARQTLEDAELVLALFDDPNLCAEDLALLKTLGGIRGRVVCLLTKQDLRSDSFGAQALEQLTRAVTRELAPETPVLALSAQTGEGMDVLCSTVERLYRLHEFDAGAQTVVFSARQKAALEQARAALTEAEMHLKDDYPYDLCAEDLREALGAIAQIGGGGNASEGGAAVREDVIREIFARFCVGK